MANSAPLVGRITGVEKRPISFEADGLNFALKAGELVDQACTGVASNVKPGEPIYLANTEHPVNSRDGLAKATRSVLKALGIDRSDTSGNCNGHFAPFA